jgi:murein DD-endopeptidase MepM/ murein hydrolase activator NlpD
MVDIVSRLGERYFPERQILIRSRGKVTNITLPSLLQLGIVSASLVAGGAFGLSALSSHDHQEAASVTALKGQLADAMQAAQDASARLRQLDAQRQARGDAADAVEAAAAVDVATLTDRVTQLQASLDQAAHQNAESRTLYERAMAQLDKLTNEEKHLKADQEKLTAEKGKLQVKLGEIEEEKDKVERGGAAERATLKQKVAELEQKLRAQPGPASAAVAASDVESTDSKQIASVENFDLDKFLSNYGIGMRASGVGGPFVAINGKHDAKADDEARKVLSALPLTAPLDHFQLESRFGVREDPFNGRKALHSGLDLSAPYQTPIYATAPGTVVFAGFASAFGKLVEIDHGNGIHTKYAHLNRIMVNVGQKLTKRTEIGLLGSSGRSTGPHVHYEVLVNGVPQDPEKFLQAGEKMFQGAGTGGAVIKASAK